ncbi:DNA-binding protein [Actinoplanes sp. CA-252034]|uniref:DNA-binding protein n=1 Tax=Actinoplanes sp. CA-252034 TaxID=3239906 RepID=UPI003D96E973
MAWRPMYLVGNREIRILLGGISRQRTYKITQRPDFPRPVAHLAQGAVWLGDQVEEWITAYRPGEAARKRLRPGSPPAADPPGFPDD